MNKRSNQVCFLVFFMVFCLGFSAFSAVSATDTASSIVSAPQEGKAVSLQGKLVRESEQGSIFLKDDSGQVQVRISPELMAPEATAEGTTVEILGVVKTKGQKSPQVEVGALTVRQPVVTEEIVNPEVQK